MTSTGHDFHRRQELYLGETASNSGETATNLQENGIQSQPQHHPSAGSGTVFQKNL